MRHHRRQPPSAARTATGPAPVATPSAPPRPACPPPLRRPARSAVLGRRPVRWPAGPRRCQGEPTAPMHRRVLSAQHLRAHQHHRQQVRAAQADAQPAPPFGRLGSWRAAGLRRQVFTSGLSCGPTARLCMPGRFARREDLRRQVFTSGLSCGPTPGFACLAASPGAKTCAGRSSRPGSATAALGVEVEVPHEGAPALRSDTAIEAEFAPAQPRHAWPGRCALGGSTCQCQVQARHRRCPRVACAAPGCQRQGHAVPTAPGSQQQPGRARCSPCSRVEGWRCSWLCKGRSLCAGRRCSAAGNGRPDGQHVAFYQRVRVARFSGGTIHAVDQHQGAPASAACWKGSIILRDGGVPRSPRVPSGCCWRCAAGR